jgi:hypothetical protein
MTKPAVALAFLVAVAPGCKRSTSRPARDAGPPPSDAAPVHRALETAVIGDIAIKLAEPTAFQADISQRDLAAAAGAVLSRSRAFAASQAEVPAGRTGVPARVTLTVTYDRVDAPTGRSIVCAVEAAIDWQAGSERIAPHANVLAEKALLPADQKRAPRIAVEMIQQSVVEAAGELVMKEELRQGEDPAVLTGLGSNDPDVVLWSLELVADRKLKGGFDRALALLKDKDAGVRTAALRALVALKDPRAVGPLAKMANFSNPEELRMVVEAVSAIGGDEAAEFLEYVATGHSDPDLRNRAREGLERIGRHPRSAPEPK